MTSNEEFKTTYRELEVRMKAQAEADGHVFLPNIEPDGPVDYIFICMEPSLSWAQIDPNEPLEVTNARGERMVAEGMRNFISGPDEMILHHAAREFLTNGSNSYHITDVSKGAILTKDARHDRIERYKRWLSLLQEELALMSKPGTKVFRVGLGKELRGILKAIDTTPLYHYAFWANKHWTKRIEGDRSGERFARFAGILTREKLAATAEKVMADGNIADDIAKDAVIACRDANGNETREKLLFLYRDSFAAAGCSITGNG